MLQRKDTYKYYFVVDGYAYHVGITNNPHRREQEHRSNFHRNGDLMVVGRRVTRTSALRWERGQRAIGAPTEGYSRWSPPKYDRVDSRPLTRSEQRSGQRPPSVASAEPDQSTDPLAPGEEILAKAGHILWAAHCDLVEQLSQEINRHNAPKFIRAQETMITAAIEYRRAHYRAMQERFPQWFDDQGNLMAQAPSYLHDIHNTSLSFWARLQTGFATFMDSLHNVFITESERKAKQARGKRNRR